MVTGGALSEVWGPTKHRPTTTQVEHPKRSLCLCLTTPFCFVFKWKCTVPWKKATFPTQTLPPVLSISTNRPCSLASHLLCVVFFLAGPMHLYFKTQFTVPILWEVFPYDLKLTQLRLSKLVITGFITNVALFKMLMMITVFLLFLFLFFFPLVSYIRI